jgi:3-oxoadipate enol-lactonase
MTTYLARSAIRRVTGLGADVLRPGVTAGLRLMLPSPPPVASVPEGRMLDLPGRGRTFVIDVPGPSPSAPTVVLLHALGCTAYLSWVASIPELSKHYRVVAFDQRWHGRGIRSPKFRFADCADDVVSVLDALGVDQAVIAGYSMGGAVAQLVWLRHRPRVSGLVLCSCARNFRGKPRERLFFMLMTAALHPLSGYALAHVDRLAQTLPELPSVDATDATAWGRAEFRSTSAWSIPEAIAELGRFNSAPWVEEVDVPTAVVLTARDRTIPVRRQRRLADAIDGAQVYVTPGGHASLFLDAPRWVPIFLSAVHDVTSRIPPTKVAIPG